MSRDLTPAKPVVTVGIVCLRENNVLLIRRRKPPRQGAWSLPGGHIEFGETAAAAALRELREETSVEGDLLGLVDVVDAIFRRHHYVIVDYAVRWRRGVPVAGDDAADARFAPVGDLGAYDLTPETLRIIDLAMDRYPA